MLAADESLDAAPAPTQLDPTDLDFWQDPHAVYRAARAQHPLAFLPIIGAWVVLRYDDVAALIRDPRLATDYGGIAQGPVGELLGRMLVAREGAPHSRLRGLLARAFTPRHIEASRPAIGAAMCAALRALPGGAVVDFQRAVADVVAARVVCQLLGIPADDLPVFAGWTSQLLAGAGINPTPEARAAADDAATRLRAYLEAMVEARRQAPADDLIHALLAAEDAGDRLSRDELVDLVFSLLLGGHDTVRSLLTITTWLALRHPEVLACLRREPAFARPVVEEVLRFEPPLLSLPRVARNPLTVAGTEIAAGSRVLLDVGAANRDPLRFPDPDRFDPTRDASGHLSFGHGHHFCIGAALARVEAQELLLALAADDPPLALVEAPRWVPFAPARRLEALPVRVLSQIPSPAASGCG